MRKTTEKVYLSSCFTNTREYDFIHGTLKQCRLNMNCDLQVTWQFGDTKLVHNEYLERQFSAKRKEMRKNGRYGRELEEHFCFLALPQSDMVEIYQNGLSTRASTMKILGNPLLGVYMFRHVDVALNYVQSQRTTVQSIMIFKNNLQFRERLQTQQSFCSLWESKKIQPCMDKNKVLLDPSPNFDCHMSRNMTSLKDTIELQAYNSVGYFYEYDFSSMPVDKPRQCLPYAVVIVKCTGQKAGNGQLMKSLSTGFPKRLESVCSLSNCTVAKRIGKGKDATVIFEHFKKPVYPFVPENCPCKALNSQMSPPNSYASSSYGNVQSGNSYMFESYSRQTHNSSDVRDASQVHTNNSDMSFMPAVNAASGNGDLFNLTSIRSNLSSISAALPSQNNPGSSTVIFSKCIKDPRLVKREQSMRKQNNSAGFPAADAVNNCLDATCFKFCSESSHCQTHNMASKNYDCSASSKIAISEKCKDQNSFSLPCYVPNASSDVGKQKYNEENAQRAQNGSNIPVLTEQSSEPQKSCESGKNTHRKDCQNEVSKALWSSDLKAVYQDGSALFPVQKKRSPDEYIQNMGMMRTFLSPEDSSKHVVKKTWSKETANFMNKTKSSPIENCITLHEEHKEGEILNPLWGNCEKIPVTHKLQMPTSPISTTEDKNELDHAALELGCNLTPNTESLSQKHPQYSLEHKGNIHTDFALARGLTELKAVQNNQNFINIMTDDFQAAKDVPLAREQLIDRVISSSTIDISLDSSGCEIVGECMYIQRKNGSEALSFYNLQKDFRGSSHIKDDVQDHNLSSDTELSSHLSLKVNLREQRDNGNPIEDKDKDSAASSPEYNADNKNESKNIVEMREIKSNTKIEVLNSEECSTFNAVLRKKGRPSSESDDSMAAIKQRHAPNDGRSVEHLVSTFPETEGSSVCVASDAAKQVICTTVLTLSTDYNDYQKHQINKTCSSEISDSSLVKHGISDGEIDIGKDKLQDISQLVNENSVLQSFELGSEIEVELEECNDATLVQQDMHSHKNVLCEESELYEDLKSRIDWEALFGNNNEELETSSFVRREGIDPHHSTECNCVSFPSQKDKRELQSTIFLPDLQVTITNVISLRIRPTDDSLELKDSFYKHVTEPTEPVVNKEKAFGVSISSQPSGENSGFSCENKFSNSVQESGHVSKYGLSHPSNSSHNIHTSDISGKPDSDSLSTLPSNVTVINDKSNCPTNPKPDFDDTRNKKDMESRSSKRNMHASSRGQNISYNLRPRETHEKRTSHDSFERFSSLSQGRIKTFSQSERHIRNVLNILNTEASLCKSKHLSRKLDKAVFHLKRAHRRVHSSLQLVSKVGKMGKGPLPKAYATICNNFWESCDLEGDSWMSERRYSTRYFLSKIRYDKQEEKRLLRFDFDESLASVSKHRSFRTDRERISECLSSKIMSGHVSGSLPLSM